MSTKLLTTIEAQTRVVASVARRFGQRHRSLFLAVLKGCFVQFYFG